MHIDTQDIQPTYCNNYTISCSTCGETHLMHKSKDLLWYECNGQVYYIKIGKKKK